MIDGRGPTRIMLACLDPSVTKDGASVRLRLADMDDETWLLELQRQPSTRRYYRNPAIPSAAEHHEWMRRTLDEPSKLLLMIEVNGGVVGTVRLDRQPGSATYEVSIAVDAAHANCGIGSAALDLIRRFLPAAQFEAEISRENLASQRAFVRAGYQPSGTDRFRNMASTSRNR
jgi:RimJ/RimL family protein N-acetyltransferase